MSDVYYYYHYDGSGNVTCVTDADKDITALYEYDAFGNIITKCGSLANDFLFSTQLANSNAGWHMYMFRSYDPMLGRWTQRDPVGVGGEINLYTFCNNDPLNFVDILGLRTAKEWADIWGHRLFTTGSGVLISTLLIAGGASAPVIVGITALGLLTAEGLWDCYEIFVLDPWDERLQKGFCEWKKKRGVKDRHPVDDALEFLGEREGDFVSGKSNLLCELI